MEFSDLSEGSIVWAVVRDARGFRKRRPAIILTPDDQLSEDEPLALIAITTTYPAPPSRQYVELPWNPDPRRAGTGLARRSAAVIDWLDTVYFDEIDELIGKVPQRIMNEIYQRLAGLRQPE